MDPQFLQIRLLGRFGVRRDGTEVPPGTFGGRLPRTLVRLLATRRGKFVPRDVLVEALWPERLPADPAANLKILASRARHALGDPSLITAGAGGYFFADDSRCQVDAEVFVAWVKAGRQHLVAGRLREALEAFLSAQAEWGGEPLAEDAYAEWAQDYRRELFVAHVEGLEGGATAALAIGDAAGAVAFAGRAAALEPLREAAHLLLVEALAASGDAAAALSAFEAFRHRLVDELGVDPSSSAQDLHLRVLRGEIVPATPSVSTAPLAPALAAEIRFVGRDVELASLLRALAGGGVVVVSGHAGAGKSRLLAEAEARGHILILPTRAFRPERDHPWSLAHSLLREALLRDVDVAQALSDLEAGALLRIVPELGEIRAVRETPADPEARRALAMQGAVKVLAAVSTSALAVVADDIQWADATSLDLLHLLADRVPGLRLVVAYRPEEVAADGPVEPFLAGLAGRAAVTRIHLGPLSPEAVHEILDDADLADLVAGETDRMPLSLNEVLQSLAAHGILEPAERGPWRAKPSLDRRLVGRIARTGQRRAIELRVESLPRPRKEVLNLLALLGREAPPRILVGAAGMAQPLVLGALDGLARAHLVRLGEHGWTVAHDVIAETIVARLSREEKGALHARLASALEESQADPAELAAHLLGAGDADQAAAAYADAAGRRLERFANQEALRLSDDGLRLDPASGARRALLEARSEARRRTGNLTGARADLESLLASMPSGPDRSVILSRMATLTSGAQDYARAAELVDVAITEAGDHPKALAEAFFVGGIVDMNRGEFERGERRFAEALSLYERLGDNQGLAGIVDARGMASLLAGRPREAAEAFDRAARLFVDCGNLLRAGNPRAARGGMLAFMGRPEEGLPEAEEALRMAQALGQLEDESFALIVRSIALSGLGRHREAVADAKRALEIAERLGHREWTCHALWVLGGLRKDAGDLKTAELDLRRALDLAQNMPLHASTAAARLALVLIARGDLQAAEPLVARALAEAFPANRPEAGLAQAELAAARGAADAAAIAREALALAEQVGYAVVVPRLRQLAERRAGS
jgi:DNA-binding SARP family transcriptional activator/tetratricopeptide (TPR) repeat protein